MKTLRTLLFYKFARIPNAEQFAADHLDYCHQLGIVGRILVADEGINGTISGTIEQCDAYIQHLSQQPLFEGIEFKIDEEDLHSFHKIHVRYRPEIVHFGVPNIDPNTSTGIYLEPDEVLAMLDEPDVVFLDTRNKVEYEVGKFKNAITLDIDTFREFPEKVDELREQYKDKRIVTYCTGGIRCEKATAYMVQSGFEADKIFQIHGGIIRYAKETGGKDFEGVCYVFDQRITVPVNEVNPSVISTCRICGKSEVRMVNCANPECNEHFVLCESCGWKMQGACSEACQQAPRLRPYDGTGYYCRTGKQLFSKAKNAHRPAFSSTPQQ
ncbi:MAG TPA: rhodanese-related sulfurtransferase [Chitinophagales bacterium]|nr:rhodanese-related sulfurtransferase [Chitinophagales bacterium]